MIGLNIAAAIWGFAEATLFFIVPDVLLSYVGAKRGPRAAAEASVFAALGAACGGVIMHLWSQSDPDAAHAAVAAVPAVSAEMMQRAQQAMDENWFTAVALGPLSSTPYKVFAVFAPHAGAPLWAFAAGSALARLPRFLLVGVGCAAAGRLLSRRLPPGAVLAILAAAWVVFYAVFFTVMN